MVALLELATYVGAALGALLFLFLEPFANGAPQEAAVAAMAIALAVIPYAASATAQRRALMSAQERLAQTARRPQ